MSVREIAVPALVASLVACSAPPSSPTGKRASGGAAARPPTGDVVAARALQELSNFTEWLHRYGARGYVGEVGWPDDSSGDGERWNRLADRWFRAADAAGLWVTVWATGEW